MIALLDSSRDKNSCRYEAKGGVGGGGVLSSTVVWSTMEVRYLAISLPRVSFFPSRAMRALQIKADTQNHLPDICSHQQQ